jgi:hypothetical protein
MYGQQNCANVNKARLNIFCHTFRPKNATKPFSDLRATEQRSLPPSEAVLEKKNIENKLHLPHVEKCLNARSVGGMGSRKK